MGQQKRRITTIFLIIVISIILAGMAESAGESQTEAPLRSNIVKYQAEELNDPFKEKEIVEVVSAEAPVLEKKVETRPLPHLIVQGIVWEGAFPQAIVNNKVVKIGDTIEEARIINIDKNGLILIFDGQQYNLTLPETVDSKNSQKNIFIKEGR